MENKNHEVVKLQVKPTNNPLLEITNDVREWLYDAFENPYYKSYIVWKNGNSLSLDFRTKWGSTYVSDEEKRLWIDATLVWDPSTQFSEKRVDIDWNPKKMEVTEWEKTVYWRDFQRHYLTNMEWIIVLSNWKFLINQYGKYQPNLSFITSVPKLSFENVRSRDLNFDEWSFSVIYWEFFISKKWTKCFRVLPKERAKHVLIRDDWWGAFNKYRWRTLPEENALYYRRASSNGGWSGYDYGVYEVNFRNEVSEDDI